MAAAYDVVVIGAGHNGLAAGAYLAKAGKKVLILERRETAGGIAATEEFAPRFKASVGPDLCGLLLPQVIQDLDLERHGLKILPLDPALFLPLPDGNSFTIWQDKEKTLQEIEKHSKADAIAYPQFTELVDRLAGFARPLLSKSAARPEAESRSDQMELLKLAWGVRRLGTKTMHQAFRILPMSVADFLNEWFEAEPLKASLASQGLTNVSMGPRSFGTAAIFLYHQLGNPGWPLTSWGLPRGGMGSVGQAFAKSAESFGASIRTGAGVSQILVKDGSATGVVLDGGEEISARLVVSNADPRTTFLNLVDPGLLRTEFRSKAERIRYRGVMAKLNLALGELPDFTCRPGKDPASHHRGLIQIGPDLDYLEKAYDDAKYRRPSTRPFLQAVIPSLSDPSLAPEGKHVMSVTMQYAPYLVDGEGWADRRESLGDAIIETLSEYAPNLSRAVIHRQVLTPLDYETIYGLPEGSSHHGEMGIDQLYFMRPIAEWARYSTPIANLYLCGSGTHPGGGITGACGFNASQQILKDN